MRHCTWASLSRFCMEAVPRKDKTMREGAWDLAPHPTSTCSALESLERPYAERQDHVQQGSEWTAHLAAFASTGLCHFDSQVMPVSGCSISLHYMKCRGCQADRG